jgi:benzoyl-CoA reductase/2-hydroxyglutaryl-CoA dehydratase subunit BcrC/BadD/HgdB
MRAALHAGRSRLSARRFADAILALRHGNTAAAVGNAAVEQPAEEIRAEEIQPGGIPLALVGGPLMPKDFAVFDVIERAGGRVVLNATETGERTLGGPIDPRALAEEPLEAMMRLYFDGVAEIFQRPNSRLYEWLGRELAARGVRGLLLRRYLWCDMWHAEFPRLKRWSPVPVLELDVCDDDRSAAGRTAGRIEAFLEMLAGTAAARTP